MYDPLTALVAITAGTGIFSTIQSAQQTRAARSTARKSERAATKLTEEEERNEAQARAAILKRRGAAGAPGLRSTILTGAQGVTGGPPATGGKALLGT